MCEKNLYPMKLACAPKYRIWGGDRLKRLFGKVTDIDRLGETWELTVRPDGMSRVENGAFAGMPLGEVIAALGNGVVSPDYDGTTFPLLIKLIDATDKISVQVHPDDAYAAREEGDVGKTEMWYVLAADEGAELVYGLAPGADAADLAAAVRAGQIEKLLSRRPVQAGDVFFIPSGLVHAIGKGILLAEIQQNSDLTYRVYDYDRRSPDGSLRPLHIEQALAVTRPFGEEEIAAIRYESIDERDGPDTLAHCRYFRTVLQRVHGTRTEAVGRESFHALLGVSGEGELLAHGARYEIRAGECWFLPAGMGEYTLRGEMQLLCASL